MPEEPQQLELLPDLLAIHGPEPEVIQVENLWAAIEMIPKVIHELRKIHKYPLSEIAVLYPTSSPAGNPEVNLPKAIQSALDRGGILHRWASKDYRAKESLMTSPRTVSPYQLCIAPRDWISRACS